MAEVQAKARQAPADWEQIRQKPFLQSFKTEQIIRLSHTLRQSWSDDWLILGETHLGIRREDMEKFKLEDSKPKGDGCRQMLETWGQTHSIYATLCVLERAFERMARYDAMEVLYEVAEDSTLGTLFGTITHQGGLQKEFTLSAKLSSNAREVLKKKLTDLSINIDECNESIDSNLLVEDLIGTHLKFSPHYMSLFQRETVPKRNSCSSGDRSLLLNRERTPSSASGESNGDYYRDIPLCYGSSEIYEDPPFEEINVPGWFSQLPDNKKNIHDLMSHCLHDHGHYLLRITDYNNSKRLALSVTYLNGKILHYIIKFRDGKYYITRKDGKFDSLEEMLEFYKKKPLPTKINELDEGHQVFDEGASASSEMPPRPPRRRSFLQLRQPVLIKNENTGEEYVAADGRTSSC